MYVLPAILLYYCYTAQVTSPMPESVEEHPVFNTEDGKLVYIRDE